jgi:hypothetical protein
MNLNFLLALAALSSYATAQQPLNGLLGPLAGQGVASNQYHSPSPTPGPSGTPVPTLSRRQATSAVIPSQMPSSSTPVPTSSASSGFGNGLPVGNLFGGGV